MRINRILISIVSIATLSSCGTSSSSNSSTTTVSSSSTTVSPDCSESALGEAAGEATYVIGCTDGWAGIQLHSNECGDHCIGYVYKWNNSKWNLLGKCSQYSLILPDDNSCQGMTGFPKDQTFNGKMSEFPPKEVACHIWDAHRFTDNLAKTGCTSDT